RSCAAALLCDSLYIISHVHSFVKNFFEIFLNFFSGAFCSRKPFQAVPMRFSRRRVLRSRAGQLDYNTTEETLCQHFFHFFRQIFPRPFGHSVYCCPPPTKPQEGGPLFFFLPASFIKGSLCDSPGKLAKVLLAVWLPRAYTGRQNNTGTDIANDEDLPYKG
ncbi:hypothetical protein, partial [uncultured Subdoligranulum sp.]|uniref:hypothetical protein n=1 Tax=uncultured Subdoligranulum sp. TaxID=512298 RepID=UPI00262F34DC